MILLDVRSHYVSGSSCDILGHEQWAWFKEQLEDKSANMTFVGTGLQVSKKNGQFNIKCILIQNYHDLQSNINKILCFTLNY